MLLFSAQGPEAMLRGGEPEKIWGSRGEHRCKAPGAAGGYRFSSNKNPGFIGVRLSGTPYLPLGFSNFKIEGRVWAAPCCWNFCFIDMTRVRVPLALRRGIVSGKTRWICSERR